MPKEKTEDLEDDFLEVGGNPVVIEEHEGVTSGKERDFVADTGDDDPEDDDELEDEGEDGEEAEEDESEGAEAAEDPAEKPKKAKTTAKERIAELVKRAKEAEKVAFEAEMALIEARKASAAPAVPQVPVEPKPSDFVYGEIDPLYLDALVEFRVAKKAAELGAKGVEAAEHDRLARENAHYQARLNAVLTEGKKKHADFEDVINSVKFDGELARLVLDSEKAVDIGYFLSNNIGKLREITRLDAAGRARAIGQLEGRFSATSAARKTTKAPEPMSDKRTKPATTHDNGKYGPRNQDDFDKAFLT